MRVIITDNIGNVLVNETSEKNYAIVNLSLGKYNVTVYNAGNQTHATSNDTKTFNILKANSKIIIEPIADIIYGNRFVVKWDGDNLTGRYEVKVCRENEVVIAQSIETTELNIVTILNATKYFITVTNLANENYTSSNHTVTLNVLPAKNSVNVTVNTVTYPNVVRVNIEADADGQYIVNAGGIVRTVNVVNGTGSTEILLDAGSYHVNATFDNSNYYSNIANSTFNVLKGNAIIVASNKSYVINYGGKYSVTLKDVNGNLINQKVTFTLNGKDIGAVTTDNNGVATIALTVKILKSAKAGKKNLVVKFVNDNYNIISKTVKITINKEKTKIVAKKKTFKKSKKVKKYTITLKNSKGKAIKKVKLTLKIKGKTFKAKTNAKGKAVFKIKKLTKKGKFTAKITFKGNGYYLKVVKKVKIKLK